MYRIIYISTARCAFDESMIKQLLTSSRTRNDALGVTGLLAYNGKRFLQALEGEREAVDQIMTRVALDPRHYALVTLDARDDITERAFGDWAMAWEDIADSVSLADKVAALVVNVPDASLQATFTGFANVLASNSHAA
jgi:hypothetical protein